MTRTKGLSPKVIGPVATALSAFVVAKVPDTAVQALIVAVIGAVAAILAPPGEVTGMTTATAAAPLAISLPQFKDDPRV